MVTLTGKDIVERILVSRRKKNGEVAKGQVPNGFTFHAIERSVSLGGGNSLEGHVLIEEPDGQFHKIDGEELLLLNEHFPEFVKAWKLPE